MGKKAAEALAGLSCCHAPDGMSPEQTSELALKWHKKWFFMLEAKAEKGGIKEAEALMNGYMSWRYILKGSGSRGRFTESL